MPKSRRYRNRSRGGGDGSSVSSVGNFFSGLLGRKPPANTEQSTTSTEATGPSPEVNPPPESSLNQNISIADSTQSAKQAVGQAVESVREKTVEVLQNSVAKINELIETIQSPPQQNPPVIGGMPGFANEYGLVQGGRLSSRKSRRRRRR